ncbi:MAG: hypothetical protein M3P51_03140 [Chloroflexota bacterium]|nr:hypothetical protein [Chloroflexota bacterium]
MLIALIAVFPGLIGDRVYRSIVGADWREKDWQAILRLMGFSVVGAALYSVAAHAWGWPAPVHLVPATYTTIDPQGADLLAIFLPYVGHLAGGLLAGSLGAVGARVLAFLAASSVHLSAWDDFTKVYAPRRWVVVSLESGEVYAGKLKAADTSVAAAERDLVLEEPALYQEDSGQYISTPYQYLFVAATTVYSIAAVYEPTKDSRVVPVGEPIFQTEKPDD